MYRTLTAARIACKNRSKQNNAAYVIVGEYGDYNVMSYAFWIGSTYGEYITMYSDGVECRGEE